MDYLNYTYNGNQVVSIADIFTPSGQTGVLEYANLSNGQNEMIYDKNGGLIADFDRRKCAGSSAVAVLSQNYYYLKNFSAYVK